MYVGSRGMLSSRAATTSVTAFQKGIRAEDGAELFFQRKGFFCLKRRFRTSVGEIDLIVRNETTLIFVEVKYRKNLLHAVEALGPVQKLRLYQAAEIFMDICSEDIVGCVNIQFDVLACAPGKDPYHIPHIFMQ